MKREAFVARLRKALHRSALDPVERPPLPPEGWREKITDPLERFRQEAEAVGTKVVLAADMAAARAAVAEVARAAGGPLITSDEELAREVAGELADRDAAPEEAAVGVTGVICAVAETGTLVLGSRFGRRSSLLPMTHLALIPRERIVADLTEAFERYAGEMPSAWVQATGPSRTADIELTLTTGVHGPGVVVAVVIG